MCTVSMIGDHFSDKWKQPDYQDLFKNLGNVNKADFEALRKEVEEMKLLLQKAIEYDKKNNEPHCETETKIKLLKEIAALFGIDLNEVLKA